MNGAIAGCRGEYEPRRVAHVGCSASAQYINTPKALQPLARGSPSPAYPGFNGNERREP